MKHWILFFFCLAPCFLNGAQEKITLYALYTPSHEILLNKWFSPSIKDDFTIITQFEPQECLSGSYKEEGWKKTTSKKVDLIIRAIKENWGNIFIFSDVDVQFFAPIQDTVLALMEHKDFLAQKNRPSGVMCSGFFVCRANQKTLDLWEDVRHYMDNHKKVSDQGALNACLNNKRNPYKIIWDYLPVVFFGGGTLTGFQWVPGKKLPIPQGILMHHANWTEGLDHKIAQLRYVYNTVQARDLMHHPRRIK